MVISGNGKESKNGSSHPFAKKDPKPTRARLVSLLDPLGRKRYSEVERYLATVQGATSGLFYYPNAWGWAVRYLMGSKNTLCTLHLLPRLFEASVHLGKEMELALKAATLDAELKRRLSRSKLHSGVKCVRTPVKNDHDYASFKTLIQLKAESLRAKKPAKPAKKAADLPVKVEPKTGLNAEKAITPKVVSKAAPKVVKVATPSGIKTSGAKTSGTKKVAPASTPAKATGKKSSAPAKRTSKTAVRSR